MVLQMHYKPSSSVILPTDICHCGHEVLFMWLQASVGLLSNSKLYLVLDPLD